MSQTEPAREEQHLYAARIGASQAASEEQIVEGASSLLVSALAAMPQGIEYQDHQLVLREETSEDSADYLIWEGALLVNVVVSCQEDEYQDWYWDRNRREGALNQSLENGADQIHWIDLKAV